MSIILYKNYYVTKCIILVGTTSATTTNNEIINYAHEPMSAFIVSAARSLTCRDDLDSKWRLLLVTYM